MKILYLGDNSVFSTSNYRALALKRLGNSVLQYNPQIFKNKFLTFFNYRTGYFFYQIIAYFWLKKILKNIKYFNFDLIWVDSGDFFGIQCLCLLRSKRVPIFLYNHDDITGPRDSFRFFSARRALNLYDLTVAVRKETFDELNSLYSLKVIRIWRSYDEVAHKSSFDIRKFIISDIDIIFVGTWIRGENRDEILAGLINFGFNVKIWGDRWAKSKYWHVLKKSFMGGAIANAQYANLVRKSKICLGFLSKQNRDLHTTRTMEIPYAGGLLCAERTSEHLALFEEGKEAVFWSTLDECIKKCSFLLANPKIRERIRIAGHRRILLNKVGNEEICSKILGILKK
jgi:spore maturation protein CgeB